MLGLSSQENLLILTKTYPTPSTKHRETTCVAALTDSGKIIGRNGDKKRPTLIRGGLFTASYYFGAPVAQSCLQTGVSQCVWLPRIDGQDRSYFGQLNGDYLPNDVQINPKVIMNEAIPHSRHASPRDRWVDGAHLFCYVFGRLAQNFNIPDHCILSLGVPQKIGVTTVTYIQADAVDRFPDISEQVGV